MIPALGSMAAQVLPWAVSDRVALGKDNRDTRRLPEGLNGADSSSGGS